MVIQIPTPVVNHQSVRPRTALLYRPVLHDDEWFMSFVLRAAHQNGCTVSTGHYLRQVESCIRQSMPADQIQRHSVDGTNKQGHSHFGALRIPDWAVRTSGGRMPFCIACFSEHQYVPMIWRLGGYRACSRHACGLLERCPACESLVRAADLFTGSCRCGMRLLDCKAPAVSPEAVTWTQRLWAGVEGLWLADANPANRTAEERRTLVERVLIENVMQVLAVRRAARTGDHRDQSHVERQARLADELGLMHGVAPSTMDGLLGGLRSALEKTTVRKQIDRIRKAALADPNALTDLPLQAYVDELASRGASIRSTEGGRMPRRDTRDGISLVQAAMRLQTSLPMIRSMIAAGVVSPARSESPGRVTHYHFTQHEIEVLRRNLRQVDGTDWLAPTGLNDADCRKFLRAGIVKLLGGRNLYRLFDRRDFDRLLADIGRRAEPCDGDLGASWISLADPVFWAVAQGPRLKMFFAELLVGDHPVRHVPNRIGLARFSVPVSVLVQLRRLERANKYEAVEREADLFSLGAAA